MADVSSLTGVSRKAWYSNKTPIEDISETFEHGVELNKEAPDDILDRSGPSRRRGADSEPPRPAKRARTVPEKTQAADKDSVTPGTCPLPPAFYDRGGR